MMSFCFRLISLLLMLVVLGTFHHADAQECPASGTCIGVDSGNDATCLNDFGGGTVEDCVCGSCGMCEWVCEDQRWDKTSLGSCPPCLACPQDGSCSSSGGRRRQVRRCQAATTIEDCLCANDACEWACGDAVWVDGSLSDLTCNRRGGNRRGLRA